MKAVCLALSGALFGLAAVAGSALARPVSYEVGGQRYTFESRDPAQVAAARKVIERAKGILMKHRGMAEEEAFRALRKMAMDRKIRLAAVAREVVAAAELLL